jgi:hypothetical protein
MTRFALIVNGVAGGVIGIGPTYGKDVANEYADGPSGMRVLIPAGPCLTLMSRRHAAQDHRLLL